MSDLREYWKALWSGSARPFMFVATVAFCALLGHWFGTVIR